MLATGTGALSLPVFSQASAAQSEELDVEIRQIDRTDFPNITVFATVEDGSALTELDTSNFEVDEDTREESIDTLIQPDSDTTTEVATSIIIDRSGSMTTGDRMENAREGAIDFVENFESGDQGQVIAFDSATSIDILEPWTQDTDALIDTIEGISPGGATALYDAVIKGVDEATGRLGRSAAVVLADGQDNDSTNDIDDAISHAQNENVPVFTIGLGNAIDPQALQDIATETGGEFYSSADGDDLESIYQSISESIAEEYELTYQTSDDTTDANERDVALTATSGSDSGSDTGTYVEPCAPLPTAMFDIPDEVRIDESVTFDGSGSQPNGGTLVEYAWDFTNDGNTNEFGETVTHTYTESGNYEARLTVEKTCGAQDVITQPIFVFEDPITISIDETNAPISEGETLEVDVELENAGSELSAAGVTLRDFEGESVHIENTRAPRGSVTELELEWETEVGDAGTDEITVTATGDRAATTEVTINEAEGGKVQQLKEQKLGNGSTPGLAPRIDDLTTFTVEEEQTVQENITGIEEALENDTIDLNLAEETLERMVLGEEVINRSLEALTGEEPLESNQTDYDLLFESTRALIMGLVESSYKLKVILADAKSELADRFTDWIPFNPVETAVEYIKSSIRNYLREMLQDVGIEIDDFYIKIINAGDAAYEEIEGGDPVEALREVIRTLVDPIAEELQNAFLAAYESTPKIDGTIQAQLNNMNTTLQVETIQSNSSFSNDISTVKTERNIAISGINQGLEDTKAIMNPESDTLQDLLEQTLKLLQNPSVDQIWSIIKTIANIVADLLSFIREGFNAGVGFSAAAQIVSRSDDVVNEITQIN